MREALLTHGRAQITFQYMDYLTLLLINCWAILSLLPSCFVFLKYHFLSVITSLKNLLRPFLFSVRLNPGPLVFHSEIVNSLPTLFHECKTFVAGRWFPPSHMLCKPRMLISLPDIKIHMLFFLCLVAQSCPTLWNPMDCSLLGSSVCGILQARVLEWVAISSSRGSSQPRDWTQVSCTAGRFFTGWTTKEAQACV